MVRILIMMILIGRVVCGLTIDPPILHEEFEDGVIASEITITNDTLEKKRYKVDIVEAEGYEKWSLKDDIKVFPRIISLEPKKRRTVRIRVVKKDLTDGEYKGYLVVREMPINIKDYAGKEIENEQLEMKIKALSAYWISVYGTYGKVDRRVEIKERVEEDRVYLEVKNIGNASKSIESLFYLNNQNNEIEKIIKVGRIMRGERKRFVLDKSILEEGSLERVIYRDSETKVRIN